jgi:signal transduction histidine kinase
MSAALRAATRDRLTAELHDVIAHELAGVSLQAGAALRLVDADPARARQLLAELHRAATGALADARRLVALDPPATTLRRAPSLASLEELADAHVAAGYAVTLHRDDHGVRPARALSVTAYRIVSDTLAHVRETPPRSSTFVGVRGRPGELGLRMVWEPAPVSPPLEDLLAVLGERAELFGGTVECSGDPSWRTITVSLPVEEQL